MRRACLPPTGGAHLELLKGRRGLDRQPQSCPVSMATWRPPGSSRRSGGAGLREGRGLGPGVPLSPDPPLGPGTEPRALYGDHAGPALASEGGAGAWVSGGRKGRPPQQGASKSPWGLAGEKGCQVPSGQPPGPLRLPQPPRGEHHFLPPLFSKEEMGWRELGEGMQPPRPGWGRERSGGAGPGAPTAQRGGGPIARGVWQINVGAHGSPELSSSSAGKGQEGDFALRHSELPI